MLSITGMTLEQFAVLMQGLGYKAERGEREKVKPVDQAIADAPADAAQAAEAETVGDVVADIPDEGVAPIAAEPVTEAEVPAALDAVPAEELVPGETPDVAAPEIEVFYTFTWAPRASRPRGERPAQAGRGPRGAQGAQGAQGAPSDGGEAQKREGRPQRQGGKPRGKPGKGKPREAREEQPKTYAAKPEKKNDRIDPDNPFAAALMGLRTKG
ncbi:helicase, putative [Roseovarius sp. 217]|nr:hypothetical protein [Roseovarius sp. 217]EAQ22810.1 helicase, putative [Roseovarius sp. 217]